MPFKDSKENPFIGSPLGPTPFTPNTVRATGHGPGALDVIKSAFQRENILGSMTSKDWSLPNFFTAPNPEYDPLSEIQGKPQYDPWRFIKSQSPQQTQSIMRELDREQANLKNIQEGGFLGVAAAMAAGVGDPITWFLPGSRLLKTLKTGDSLLSGALSVGKAGLLDMTIQETLLQFSQESRGVDESLLNVGAGTLLSGMFGGGASAWSRYWNKELPALTKKSLGDIQRGLETDFTLPPSTFGVQSEVKSAQQSADAFADRFGYEDLRADAVRELQAVEQRMLEAADMPDVAQAQTALGSQINQLRKMAQDLQEHLDNPPGWERVYDTGESVAQAEASIRRDLSSRLGSIADELEQRTGLLTDALQLRELVNDINKELQPARRALLGPDAEVDNGLMRNPALDAEAPKVDEGGTPGAETPNREGVIHPDDDELLKDHELIRRIPGVNVQDPLIRTLLSRSKAARRAVQRMAENPLKLVKNLSGIATRLPAEVMAKMTKYPLFTALGVMDDAFLRYRTGRKPRILDRGLIEAGDALGGNGAMLNWKQFKEAVGNALANGDSHPIPEVALAAKAMRQNVFDPAYQRAVKLGLLPEGLEPTTAASYVTRLWDNEAIVQHYDEFFEINYSWLKSKENLKPLTEQRTDAQLRQVAKEVIGRILGSPAGRLPYEIKLPGHKGFSLDGNKAGEFRARVYDIPDELVEKFLERDAETIAKMYEAHTSPYMAMVEEFGDIDLTKELKEIDDEYAEMMLNASSPQERSKLEALRQRDMSDLIAMRDRILGRYNIPENPDAMLPRIARALKEFNLIRTMGGVVFSSLSDIARPMMVMGLRSYLEDGLIPLVKNFKTARLSAEEVMMAGTATDMMNNARLMNAAEIMDDYGRRSTVERLLSDMAQGFSKVSGMSLWNSEMKKFSGLIVQTNIMKAASAIVDGTATPKQIANLAASYIDEDMALRIAVQFEQHGEMIDGIAVANTTAWDDLTAVDHYRAAIQRDVNRIIVDPGQDKPLWMSSQMGGVLGQFKSFFFASMQRVVLSGLQERDMRTLSGLVFMVGMGAVTGMIKAAQAGREFPTSPDDILLEAVDRSGATGWLMDGNHMLETFTRGHVGINGWRGKKVMSRYASRNFFDALMGPSAGSIQDLATVTGTGLEYLKTGDAPSQGEVHAFRRLMPYQNLWQIRGLFDRAESGLADYLGVQPRKEQSE